MFCRRMQRWIAPIPKCLEGGNRKSGTSQKKRSEKAKPLEVKLDLGVKFVRGYVEVQFRKWKRGAFSYFVQF